MRVDLPGHSLAAHAVRVCRLLFSCLACVASLGGCRDVAALGAAEAPLLTAQRWLLPLEDVELRTCLAHVRSLRAQPDLGGNPALDAQRADVLGRALGEPMVFVRTPTRRATGVVASELAAAVARFERGRPGARVVDAVRRYRHQPPLLRALLLPEGYLVAADPHDALALVRSVQLPLVFRDDVVWLQRKHQVVQLQASTYRGGRLYRYVEGPEAGDEAQLLFGDRVALDPAELSTPLHRDVRSLAEEVGFERARVTHHTTGALVAELRMGGRWVEAVLVSKGAELEIGCMAAPQDDLAAIQAWRATQQPRLRALAAMRRTLDVQVREKLRFDRPRDDEDHFRDGSLRAAWFEAYRRGASAFGFDGESYMVFLADGRPWPPQVCVDLVLDTYERTSGTWFRPRGHKPERVVGRLDFNAQGIKNRRGVIAFGEFAEQHPELFAFMRLRSAERIPFTHRRRFFAFLREHADEFRAGDVVAIQGRKRDGYIHQHAILIESVDPVTGFPAGLVDQMRWPRRRTWEGIMAEAPARSVYYRARPTDIILRAMDPEWEGQTPKAEVREALLR